jgi:GAF domain-containing protein
MSNNIASKKKTLLSSVAKIVDHPQKTFETKLQDVCQLLFDKVEVFDWVGFYMVDPDADRELVLGPFVGEATEHTRIPFGTGICGQAAETNETFVVQDVNEESNYLACSVEVKAEIVAPVKKNGKFVAELDIDSHTRNSMSEDHKDLVEEVCELVAPLF